MVWIARSVESCIIIQPAIFEERGLSVPTTWDEFMDTGAILAEEGIALSYLVDHGGMFMMYLLQRKGEIFNEHGEFVLPRGGEIARSPLKC